MICHHCAQPVPRGAFCTLCGTPASGDSGAGREQHFAAHPGEHVAQPSIFTTLLPHLHPGRLHEFRLALAGGLLVVVIMALAGLVAGALVAAAVLVPSLYVVYMFEHRVYGDAPLAVLGLTIVGGAVLGAVLMVIVHITFGERLVSSLTAALILDVLVPLVQVVLIATPALALRHRVKGGVIDGLAVGVASGLGFAAGEGIVRFVGVFPVLSTRSSVGGWAYALVGATALVPLLHAATGGAVSGAFWGGRRGHAARMRAITVPLVAVAAIAFYGGAEFIQAAGVGTVIAGLYQLVMVMLVIVCIRYLVHHAMLDESAGVPLRPITCPHCGHHEECAGFCPRCGAATRVAVSAGGVT